MKIAGNLPVPENVHWRYLVADKNWPYVGTKQLGEAADKMTTKIGRPRPLFVFQVGRRQTLARCPRFPYFFMGIAGNSSVSNMALCVG